MGKIVTTGPNGRFVAVERPEPAAAPDEPVAALDEPAATPVEPVSYVVGRNSTFVFDGVLVTLPRGRELADPRIIAGARAAGVSLIATGESDSHVVCPHCGKIVALDAERALTYAGLTRGQLSMITNRSR